MIESARKFFTKYFTTEFLARIPDAVIRYENVKFETQHGLPTKPVVYIVDEPVTNTARNLGLREKRLRGYLHVIAMAPDDSGTKTIRRYLDTAYEILGDLNLYVPDLGYVTVEDTVFNTLRLHEGFYSMEAVFRYSVDVCNT